MGEIQENSNWPQCPRPLHKYYPHLKTEGAEGGRVRSGR